MRGVWLMFTALWLVLAALWITVGLSGCCTHSEKGQGPISDLFTLHCRWVTSNEATHCFCFMDGFNGSGRMTWAPNDMCGGK